MRPDPHLQPLFDAYVDAWQRFDEPALVACFSDEATFIDPYPSTPNIGKAGVSNVFARIEATVAALRFEVGRSILCGDRGIFPFELLATLRADGITQRIRATDVVIVKDGLIHELVGYGDFAGATVEP
jgi:hypothetical protein